MVAMCCPSLGLIGLLFCRFPPTFDPAKICVPASSPWPNWVTIISLQISSQKAQSWRPIFGFLLCPGSLSLLRTWITNAARAGWFVLAFGCNLQALSFAPALRERHNAWHIVKSQLQKAFLVCFFNDWAPHELKLLPEKAWFNVQGWCVTLPSSSTELQTDPRKGNTLEKCSTVHLFQTLNTRMYWVGRGPGNKAPLVQPPYLYFTFLDASCNVWMVARWACC